MKTVSEFVEALKQGKTIKVPLMTKVTLIDYIAEFEKGLKVEFVREGNDYLMKATNANH